MSGRGSGDSTTPEHARAEGRNGPRPAAASVSGDGVSSDERSVPQLLKELSTEGVDLMRQEVELAKAEMSEKVSVYQRNLVSVVVGGVFLVAALLFAVWAVNTGVTALLAEIVGVEIAVWLSPLLIGALLGLVGWAMIKSGQKAMREEGVTPHRTKQTLKNDKRWVESKAREVKEEIKHG